MRKMTDGRSWGRPAIADMRGSHKDAGLFKAAPCTMKKAEPEGSASSCKSKRKRWLVFLGRFFLVRSDGGLHARRRPVLVGAFLTAGEAEEEQQRTGDE